MFSFFVGVIGYNFGLTVLFSHHLLFHSLLDFPVVEESAVSIILITVICALSPDAFPPALDIKKINLGFKMYNMHTRKFTPF